MQQHHNVLFVLALLCLPNVLHDQIPDLLNAALLARPKRVGAGSTPQTQGQAGHRQARPPVAPPRLHRDLDGQWGRVAVYGKFVFFAGVFL
jgi:hypothetical protein